MVPEHFESGALVVVPHDVYAYVGGRVGNDDPTCIPANSVGLVCALHQRRRDRELTEYVVAFDGGEYTMLACEMRSL